MDLLMRSLFSFVHLCSFSNKNDVFIPVSNNSRVIKVNVRFGPVYKSQ